MTTDIPRVICKRHLTVNGCIFSWNAGRMGELLAMIDPKPYRSKIIIKGGKPVLYAELRKALYGMLQSALQF